MFRFLYDAFRLKRFFKGRLVIFIHIPKSAGLSVCEALYHREIGHFSMSHFEKRYGEFLCKYFVRFVTIVRDPVSRFESAINYIPVSKYRQDQAFYNAYMTSFQSEIESFLHNREVMNYIHFKKASYYLDRLDKYAVLCFKLENINDLYKMLSISEVSQMVNVNKIKSLQLDDMEKAQIRAYYAEDYQLIERFFK